MPTIAPMAAWRPLSGKSRTLLQHDIVCLHTMVGTLSGSVNYAAGAGNPYWHFGLNAQGFLGQYQDLDFRSAANLEGNWHVIPIETSDLNEGVWPTTWAARPWTQAQLDKLVELVAWLCVRYDIPPVLIPDTRRGRRGIAYHRQGINPWRVADGEKWSNANGKGCPTDPRIGQLVNNIIPRVQALVQPAPKDWFDMATKAELEAVVTERTAGRLCRVYDPETGKWDPDRVWVVTPLGKFWIQGWENVALGRTLGLIVAQAYPAGQNPTPYKVTQAYLDTIPTLPTPKELATPPS